MSLLEKYDTKQLQIFVGFLATIVVIYRLIFMMIPMFREGYKENDYAKMFKSLSLLV
mgnify:FL=1